MLFDRESLLETIYSLPVIAQSVAIATRTPTAGYKQDSRFMPDFGGTLDIPGTSLKNNSLSDGLPFQPKPKIELVQCRNTCSDGPPKNLINHDCLVVSKYLESCRDKQFSTARALGKTLYFDSFEEIFDRETSQKVYTSTPYAQVPYTSDILGIKRQQDFILIKFNRGCKTIQLIKSFNVDNSGLSVNNQDDQQQPALVFTASILEPQIRDSCLNNFNSALQAIGTTSGEGNKVRLYDLTKYTRVPLLTVSWPSDGSDSTSLVVKDQNLRRRVLRTFSPAISTLSGIQQLDHIPSHLINMLATTSTQTCLIDPRQETIAQVFVDKSKLSSFYPIELVRRSEFSRRNNYQFYSLTNVHLRVFDTRYHGVPMNQLNHMLDSNSYEELNLKLINHREGDLETLCCSTSDALCLTTIDQTRVGKLINPRVAHLPYIESSINEFMSDRDCNLFGLDVMANDANEDLFLTMQLSAIGDVCIRKFLPSHGGCEMDIDSTSQLSEILESDNRIPVVDSGHRPDGFSLDIPSASDSDLESHDEYLDILDSDILDTYESQLESKRALERFEYMKNKLDM